MYTSLRQRRGLYSVAGVRARQTPVAAHEGSYGDYLRRHELSAITAARGTRQDQIDFASILPTRAADPRNIMCATDYLSREPKAPGPNGIRLDQLTSRERWQMARAIGQQMRDGGCHAGPCRRVDILKSSGIGTRPLELTNVEDRVAQRALAQVIQPYLDPNMDARSFGFRSGLGREHALATADPLITQGNSPVVITADLRDAFTQVPLNRLFDILRTKHLPEALVEQIRLAIGHQRRRGLPQGGPISPLLLNVYADHFLDRRWRRQNPTVPLLRDADDLLVVCDGEQEARESYHLLQRLTRDMAMPLKGDTDTDVRRLDQGEAADWLGYRISWTAGGLGVGIGNRAWDQLHKHLSDCHSYPDAPLRAVDTVLGWVDQLGPCYRWEDVESVYARITDMGRDLAYEELPPATVVGEAWERAYVRYRCLRRCMSRVSSGDGDGSACAHRDTADIGRGCGASHGGVPQPSFSLASGDQYTLHTDGACQGSRGIGGWAYVLDDGRLGGRTSRSGCRRRTTNNRMELTAVIRGLEALPSPARVLIVTDSRYVHDGITQYVAEWSIRRWRRRTGGPVRNDDLWRRLVELLERHDVRCTWVRGHSGHAGNEECDRLAQAAISGRQV